MGGVAQALDLAGITNTVGWPTFGEATRKIRKCCVDSRRPVRLVSGAALRTRRLATHDAPGPARSKLLYKSSGPDTASAQRSTLITQGEHHALHDDYVSERLRKRKGRHGARLQRHGSNGQVQRGTRESRRAARARRAHPTRNDERARHFQKRKIDSYRRSVYRSEGSGRRLLDHPGEITRRGTRMGLAHPRKRQR